MTETFGEVIRSADNRLIKRIRSLRQRSTREQERAFVVEGVRAVEDSLAAGGRAQAILVREDTDWEPSDRDSRRLVRRVEERVFNSAAETVSPQPIMAIFEFPSVAVDSGRVPLILVLDGIRDPGNLGTLLRSAAGASVTVVLLAPGTVDPFNPKVARAGMGVHFRLPIESLDDAWHHRLVSTISVRALADARGEQAYDAVDWRQPSTIIVGSEAHGPSAMGRAIANTTIAIPLGSGIESLNAGVAGSIIMFEAARQRTNRN